MTCIRSLSSFNNQASGSGIVFQGASSLPRTHRTRPATFEATPRSDLALGHRAGRPAAQRFREGRAYTLERWTGLTRFVEDARIPLDNNAACPIMPRDADGRLDRTNLRTEIVANAA
jgi:hypothetical protein